MYPGIPWGIFADPSGSAKQTLGITVPEYAVMYLQNYLFMKFIQYKFYSHITTECIFANVSENNR